MELKISNVEDRGNFKTATAVGEGNGHKVSVWKTLYGGAENPMYSLVQDGATVNAGIKESADGKFKNLIPEIAPPKFLSNKGGNIKEAQERKAQYIEKAQDRKEESIAFFNATNAAIAMVNGAHTDKLLSQEDLELLLIQWRKFFLNQWILHDNTPH